MGKKKEAAEKVEWKFFWKNVDGLGMLLRVGAGIAFLAAARMSKDDKKRASLLTVLGVMEVAFGLLKWCPLRALRGKPTKRAYLKHYPEAEEA